MNARQQAFRDSGLCVQCGDKPRGVNPNTRLPYVHCQVCSDKNAEGVRQRQRSFRRRGACIKCGRKSMGINSLTEKPYLYCDTCNDKNNERTLQRRERYKHSCRCRNCGKPVADVTGTSCEQCRAKRRQRR